MSPDDRWLEWQRFQAALSGRPLPCAFLDLDALEANLATLLARADPRVTLRIATKSVRVPAVLAHVADRGGNRLAGWLAYAAGEAALLVEHGLDDILIAYPCGTPADAAIVAGLVADGHRVVPMIDAAGHVTLLDDAAAAAGTTITACLDVDVSLRPAGLAHLGVRRSPVRTVARARAVGRAVHAARHVELGAVMAYEAQVAGLPDRQSTPVEAAAVRWIKARSVALAAERRRAVVAALTADGHRITVVNGGGTGSLVSTSADPTVTEVAAGSGLFAPHLFDGYRDLPLVPAAFFAIPVVRHPAPGFVTCAGGGYVASGAVGRDRLPIVHAPAGLEPIGMEGFGEVQTPLRWTGDGGPPTLGAPIVCRHAKAGELMERFDRVLWVRGDTVVGDAPTYRGLGRSYL